MKRLMKRGFKRALRAGGTWARTPPPCSRILTYHSIGYRVHEMNVTPENFAAQMRWLARTQRVITLEEAAGGAPGVAVTFDDGYRDNLYNAAPVLRELEIPATVFMVAGRAGMPLDKDPEAETGVLMTWDEVRRLHAGGIQVGGHTMSHPRLSLLNDDEQCREIAGCKALLEDQLLRPVNVFAYPYGSALDYDAVSMRCVRDAGYAVAVSNRYGPNTPDADRLQLRRIWIDATDTLGTFQAKTDGRLDALALLDSGPGIRARRAINRLLRVG